MANERKSIISAAVDEQAGTITFAVAGIGQMVLDVGQTKGTNQRAMYHGYEQKVRDAAAIPRDTKTGASATPKEKYEAMLEVVQNLHDGIWNAKGGASAKALNRGALFQAIGEVRQRDAAEVEAKFRDRPDEVLRAFLTHKDIAGVYARLTTQDTGAADELLSELE